MIEIATFAGGCFWGEEVHHEKPIATKIEPAKAFWPAEDYHQQYLEKRGLASCMR